MEVQRARPPSVDRVLAHIRPKLEPGTDPEAVTLVARDVVEAERSRLAAGEPPRPAAELATDVEARLAAFLDPAAGGARSVINGTGVIVHTNLGRAAWPAAAIAAATIAAAEPVLLELDRSTGRRGPRARAAEEHLIALTGAEGALVTNNNAAALALAVGLARRSGVAVSRGELVEIGGGVRIPDIVRRVGARLIEVGTTNRTRVADFEAALSERRVALILRVHPSNFRQSGFVESAHPAQLATLARGHGIPLVDDLGSGALIDSAAFDLAHEPTARERLEAGADLVTFSGDKLLGGPQAGLIVGRADLVARIRRDPLARAVRPDKVTAAAVAATLGIYRAGRATLDIPVWRAIAAPLADLHARAMAIAEGSGSAVAVTETQATIGGGALPGETLPSFALRIVHGSADRLAQRLRAGDPSVIGRIDAGAVLIDLRTVSPEQDGALTEALERALA